jgi:menaquinone-dependent protoporphyrinogen oxidase
MTKILIAYGTTEGQTAQIADHLAEVIRGRGLEVKALDLKQSKDVSLDGFEAVIIGGSVHMGKHQSDVVDFVRKNRVDLERLPSAFFSVSLAASGDLANAEAYVENFTQQTGWRPTKVGLFSGALLYRQYNFLKRYMMKRIVRGQARHAHRYVARLRLHQLGPSEAVRRRFRRAAGSRRHRTTDELVRRFAHLGGAVRAVLPLLKFNPLETSP